MGSITGDIGASMALASANAATQNAGTVFNFDSPGASGDTYATETGASSTAKATASKNVGGNFSPQMVAVVAVLGIAAFGVTFYLLKR